MHNSPVCRDHQDSNVLNHTLICFHMIVIVNKSATSIPEAVAQSINTAVLTNIHPTHTLLGCNRFATSGQEL